MSSCARCSPRSTTNTPARRWPPSGRCWPSSRRAVPPRSRRWPRSPRATKGQRSICAVRCSVRTAASPSGSRAPERSPTPRRWAAPWPATCATKAPITHWECSMTRTRKGTGRIAFVGAGPGDPGLLTRRAYEALVSADHIVYDRNVPESLLSVVRADADPETQFSPAEGAPGDVAKVLLSAARSGLRAIHLVGGDPLAHDTVLKEVQAVARTAVPFEVVPGIGQAAGVATYAGVPLPGVRVTADVDDVQSVDFEAVASAVTRGSSALAVDAGDLATVRDGLLAAGVD